MAYVSSKHDLGLLRVDGSTKVGLILAKDEKGNKIYEEYDDEYLALHQTSEAGYSSLQPEKEFRIGGDSYRAGFGLLEADSSDPERYHVANNLDMRNRSLVLPSNAATAVTMPATTVTTVPSIANPTMEDNSSWTGGAQASDQKYQGTYSWKRSTNGTMSQNCTTWTNDWRSKSFTFKAWVRSSGVNVARIYISDGVGTTNSSNNGAINAWSQLTVTRTLDASATQLQVGCENQTGGAEDVWFDLCEITAPACSGATVAGVDFNDELYVARGNSLTKLNANGDTLTSVKIMPALITDLETFQVSGTDYLFIALGTSAPYWYMNTSETFTQSTATESMFKFFQRVHAAADTMWGAVEDDLSNSLRSTVDPLNGGTVWSTQTIIGEASNAITGLLSFQNLLYIMKTDRPYYLDSSNNVKILTNITAALRHADGGKNSAEWNGNIYMPWSTQSLLEYNDADATFTWLNPSDFGTEIPDFDGQVQAVAGDDKWLFAAVNNSTKVEIMCGRYEVINSTIRWVWHPYYTLTMTGVEAMWISTVYQKRVWIASNTAAEALQYIPLPLGYGDLGSDGNRAFASGGYFETSWQHANFKGDSKAFIKCTLTMGNTGANVYWEGAYCKLGDSSFTNIHASHFKTSPTTTRYIPVDSSSNNPVSSKMKFKFTAITNSTTNAPYLYGWDVRGILYPTRRDLIYCEVRCADNLTLNDDTIDRDTGAAEIKAALEELKNTATYPATFYDIDGNTIKVKLLSTSRPFSKIVRMDNVEGSKKLERRYYLLLEKVTTS